MPQALLTFLGAARRQDEVDYDFGDGTIRNRVFGLALLDHLRARQRPAVDRIRHARQRPGRPRRHGRRRARARGRAGCKGRGECGDGGRILDPLEPTLSGGSVSRCAFACCRTPADQIDILRLLRDQVERGDGVTFDLTHGLRHLPMLGLLSAFYVTASGEATIRSIYYGARDLGAQGRKPVFRLDGLLRIIEWIAPSRASPRTATTACSSPSCPADGVPVVVLQELERAAFLERVTRIEEAEEVLEEVRDELPSPLAGISGSPKAPSDRPCAATPTPATSRFNGAGP